MTRDKNHKTRTASVTTTRPVSYCAQKGCRFKGKPVVQGVCWAQRPEVLSLNRLIATEKRFRDELEQFKRTEGKNYLHWLEGYCVMWFVNCTAGTDMLIRERRDNALLRLRVEKLQRKRPRATKGRP